MPTLAVMGVHLHEQLHVFPDIPFFFRVSKQISRMKSRQQANAAVQFVEPASQPGYGLVGVQEGLGGYRPQADDKLGTDGGDLALQKRQTGPYFIRIRVAVFGGRHLTMLQMYTVSRVRWIA